jgi:hypothetical protein
MVKSRKNRNIYLELAISFLPLCTLSFYLKPHLLGANIIFYTSSNSSIAAFITRSLLAAYPALKLFLSLKMVKSKKVGNIYLELAISFLSLYTVLFLRLNLVSLSHLFILLGANISISYSTMFLAYLAKKDSS